MNHRPDAAAEEAFRSVLRVVGLIHRTMQPYFTRFGISGAQWAALRALRRAEEEGTSGLCLTDLGDRLLVRLPSVTGLVDRLQRIGYVVRRSAPSDLRSKEVRLTAAGRRLVMRVLSDHGAQVAEVMGGLDAADLRHFNELLQRMAAHLQLLLHRGMLVDSSCNSGRTEAGDCLAGCSRQEVTNETEP